MMHKEFQSSSSLLLYILEGVCVRDREKEGVCVSVNERDSVWQRERMCERGCMCV